jgi:outer membrane protein assembly factor BamB
LKVKWKHSLTEEYGRVSGYGGRITSPIIDGDLLIMSMVQASWGEFARGGVRFVAFDKKTGEVVWWASTGLPITMTNFSYPVVKVINGERLLISGGADGAVHAFKVRTGEKVWSYKFGTSCINLTPVVDGNFVYIGHGEGSPGGTKQGRFICLDASKVKDGKPELVWQVDGLLAKFSSPIVDQGKVYVVDDTGSLFCLDAKTGKELWDYSFGAACMASPILADGKIYVGEVNDNFYILKPGAKGCEELHKQEFVAPGGGVAGVEINGSAAVANGRVYVQTSHELYCLGLKDAKTGEAPAGEKEEPADPNAKPTHLQVFPADVVLEPGTSQEFKARTFDAKGRFLKEVKVKWSVAAMLPPPPLANQQPPPPGQPAPPPPPVLQGEVTETGKLTVSDKVPAQFGRVVADLDGLQGYARVRVVPKPTAEYKADFTKVPLERTPGGWVNAQGKFQVVALNNEKVLKKLANNSNPGVARANTFFGLPTMTGYTIQANVRGTKANDDMPDAGVLNCRYGLLLDGNKQRLRLVSWEDLPRIDKTVAYAWKPDTWHTLKLTVEQKDGKALIRGKVWPSDQAEPKEWTLEFEDPIPNKEGSPGLYGYATGILPGAVGAEIFYDKVMVTPK